MKSFLSLQLASNFILLLSPLLGSTWHLKPTFEDFKAIENNPNSKFPYKFIAIPGNYSDLVAKVIKPRGFSRVIWKESGTINDIDFIWKPTNFSSKVSSK